VKSILIMGEGGKLRLVRARAQTSGEQRLSALVVSARSGGCAPFRLRQCCVGGGEAVEATEALASVSRERAFAPTIDFEGIDCSPRPQAAITASKARCIIVRQTMICGCLKYKPGGRPHD